MSDTPRSDAILDQFGAVLHPACMAYNSLCRELERENAKLRQRIPHTADGHPIFIGDEVWFYDEDSRGPLSAKVTWICAQSPSGHAYPGKFVIGADWYEDGDSKFYHLKDAVPIPSYH